MPEQAVARVHVIDELAISRLKDVQWNSLVGKNNQ
jgi:hypothetical protein